MALDDGLWLRTLTQAGVRLGLPLVAAGDVHLHARAAKPLQDVLTAVRLGRAVAARCSSSLDEIKYRYPLETVLPGMTAQQTLAWLAWLAWL